MKKMIALVLGLVLVLAAACAETVTPVFEMLDGMEWTYTSGVGGWSTEMYTRENGSFIGYYHDSEMGETGNGYPNGTIYVCSFTGQMGPAEQVDENTWRIRVDSVVRDETPETIDEGAGVRFVPSDVCGVSEGETFLLYRPGTPVSVLTEEMKFWAHITDQETPPAELESWFLASETNDSGFVGYPPVAMVNPWEDMTAEQLAEASGLSFAVPEGAENVIYRYLRSEGLAEMQFTIGGDSFCARIQPAALEEGSLLDISGMYYTWEHEEPVSVRGCGGTIAVAQADGADWVELCQWYDAQAGLMRTLSVHTPDPDGLDLAVIAEQTVAAAK